MSGQGIMTVFEMLLITACLLHLSGQGFGQSDTCKPDECWNCALNSSHNCTNGVPQNCTIKEFNVTILNTTQVKECSDVTVTCHHNLPNGSISWKKDNVQQSGENKDTLQIKGILKNTVIDCFVSSVCGVFNSTSSITVEAANNMVIILICVGGAAGLLMLFAIGMKIVLKRGQVQSQARKRQRQQNMENIHSTVNTVTSYY